MSPGEANEEIESSAVLSAAIANLRLELDPERVEQIWIEAAGLRLSAPATFLRLATLLRETIDSVSDCAATSVTPEIDAMTWCCYGEALNSSGRLNEALTALDNAVAAAEDAERTDLLGRILVGRVHVLSLSGSWEAADREFERARDLLQRHAHDELLGKLFTNRGNAFYQRDRYREAYEAYAQADTLLARSAPEDPVRGVILLNRAIVAAKLDLFDDARQLYESAQERGDSLGLSQLGAYARFNRALLEQLFGDYRTALRLLDEAELFFDAQRTRDMKAAVLRARADIALELGMSVDACRWAHEAAELFTADGNQLDSILCTIVEARSSARLGEHRSAIELLERAATRLAEQDNLPRHASTLLHVAEVQLAAGNPELARRLTSGALASFTDLRLQRWIVRSRELVARCDLALGDTSAARASLEPVLAKMSSLTLNERQRVWETAGRIARRDGRRHDAVRMLGRAARYLEDGRRLVPGQTLRALRFEHQRSVYDELIELELERPAPRSRRLLQLVERARSRGVRDWMSSATPAPGQSPMVGDRVRLGSLTRRLEEAELDPATSRDRTRISTLRRQCRTLERELAAERRRTEELETSPPEERFVHDPGVLAGSLCADEVLLGYYVLAERVLALVLTPERMHVAVLPAPVQVIRDSVERVAFQIDSALLAAGSPATHWDFLQASAGAALTELHGLVLGPVVPLLPEEGRLTIVAHDFLNNVPFECLGDDRGLVNDRWVVGREPLADAVVHRGQRRARRAALADEMRAREGDGGRPPAALVAGIVESGPASVAEELGVVAALLRAAASPSDATPPGDATPLCDVPPLEIEDLEVLADPSTSQLLGRMSGVRLLHLVTHGALREDNPAFSRLSTADGALFMADILERRLAADLVVLSACQTGRVFTGSGEDLAGLALAFLIAGAGSLVASLWRVDDRATLALVTAFYERLLEGRGDPARALQGARAAVREEFRHPAFWGSFCAYGR